MKTLAEKIAVMQAFADGKQIEFLPLKPYPEDKWLLVANPHWNWEARDYRVVTPDPLRKLSVEETKCPSCIAWYVSPLSAYGVYNSLQKHHNIQLARRGEAYATREGALAEAKRRWGDKL